MWPILSVMTNLQEMVQGASLCIIFNIRSYRKQQSEFVLYNA